MLQQRARTIRAANCGAQWRWKVAAVSMRDGGQGAPLPGERPWITPRKGSTQWTMVSVTEGEASDPKGIFGLSLRRGWARSRGGYAKCPPPARAKVHALQPAVSARTAVVCSLCTNTQGADHSRSMGSALTSARRQPPFKLRARLQISFCSCAPPGCALRNPSVKTG